MKYSQINFTDLFHNDICNLSLFTRCILMQKILGYINDISWQNILPSAYLELMDHLTAWHSVIWAITAELIV